MLYNIYIIYVIYKHIYIYTQIKLYAYNLYVYGNNFNKTSYIE